MQVLINPINVKLVTEQDPSINPFGSPQIMRVLSDQDETIGNLCIEYTSALIAMGFRESGGNRTYWHRRYIGSDAKQMLDWFLGNFNLVTSDDVDNVVTA